MIWKKQPIANQLATLNSKFTITPLYSGSDLNTLKGYNGIRMFYVGAGVTNSPLDYAMMIVISRDGEGLASQLIIGEDVYSRTYIGSPPAWSAWKKLS